MLSLIQKHYKSTNMAYNFIKHTAPESTEMRVFGSVLFFAQIK